MRRRVPAGSLGTPGGRRFLSPMWRFRAVRDAGLATPDRQGRARCGLRRAYPDPAQGHPDHLARQRSDCRVRGPHGQGGRLHPAHLDPAARRIPRPASPGSRPYARAGRSGRDERPGLRAVHAAAHRGGVRRIPHRGARADAAAGRGRPARGDPVAAARAPRTPSRELRRRRDAGAGRGRSHGGPGVRNRFAPDLEAPARDAPDPHVLRHQRS